MSLMNLPVEILHTIVQHLDLMSIHNLCLTNQTTRHQIQAHPFYQLLTTDPTFLSTIKILSQTSLIHLHPLSTLISALSTTTCSCCQRPYVQSPYLSLPLGTRACFTCLHDCPQFQLIPTTLAAETFGLPESAFTQAGIILNTIPGTYRVKGRVYKFDIGSPLVNGMQARTLALQTKSAPELDRYMARREIDVASYWAPIATMATFVTPYSGMAMDVCSIRARGELLGKGQDKSVATGDRVGLVIMGCELWPKMTGKMEFMLDRGPVMDWRLRNDYWRNK